MPRRRANGEGTIYRRQDGRFEGAAYFLTITGKRKRLRVYGRTRNEVSGKLIEAKARAHQGIPLPDRTWKLGEYLDYWLENIVRRNRRPTTQEQYDTIVRLYLKPALASRRLHQLSVPLVQAFVNEKLAAGHSVRRVQIMRTVLSAALTQALREELVTRNVARLVELPAYEKDELQPWSVDEARQFLWSARSRPLYVAFALLVLYGLRRGEVLGLRWHDIDLPRNQVHIRQQLVRIRGTLHLGPVKTDAGRRDLPLLGILRELLSSHHTAQTTFRDAAGEHWKGAGTTDELVFTTRSGLPIEPRNFLRLFRSICTHANVRPIRLHDLRHSLATFLEALGVPPRQAQLILGHAHVSTTQQIYTHPNLETRRQALEQVERLFLRAPGMFCMTDKDRGRCRQILPSTSSSVANATTFLSGSGEWTRTTDPRLMRSLRFGLSDRLQSVNLVMNDRRRQWLLGAVAVNFSRQGEEASCGAE